jgi:MOSC domain-containing protein YiiM
MVAVEQITLVAGKGIAEDARYFGRRKANGEPNRRQVTLIEREQIGEHASVLGLTAIGPGRVRSNIETDGISLAECIGSRLQIGEAILFVHAPRTPCEQMEAIAPGLRKMMENDRQGVLAEVVRGGVVRVGDSVRVLEANSEAQPRMDTNRH